MWSTAELSKIWTNAFIQYYRDILNRQIAMNQPVTNENVTIETEYGYISGRVEFKDDTNILDTHEYIAHINEKNIGEKNTLLLKPFLILFIDMQQILELNDIVYFPVELNDLHIQSENINKLVIKVNNTKLIFLSNHFRYYGSFGFLDTLVVLHKYNLDMKYSATILKTYIKNLYLTCENINFKHCYIEYLNCPFFNFLYIYQDIIVEKLDIYNFNNGFSYTLQNDIVLFAQMAEVCHKISNEKYKQILNVLPSEKMIQKRSIIDKKDLLKDDKITYYICNKDEFEDLDFYGDILLDDYKEKLSDYVKIPIDKINTIKNGFSFKYNELFTVNIIFMAKDLNDGLEEYRYQERAKWESMRI